MDTLLSIKVFCQVVQSNSFTRAAELLDMSIPMTSKHVHHLEKQLGTQLLYRNNRHLKLTEQGEIYYRNALTALDILFKAAHQANDHTAQVRGILRVSVPVWFACPMFAQWVVQYQQRFPEVELILTLSNKLIDLNSDGEDLALRLSHHLPDNVIAKKLTMMKFYLIASKDYITQHGSPKNHEDLSQYRAILPNYVDISKHEVDFQGKKYHFQFNATIRSNHTQMLAELIRAGAGIGLLPSWLVQDDLASGKLIHLLPDYHFPDIPLYAVYTNREFMSAKVRSFIDFMAEKMHSLT